MMLAVTAAAPAAASLGEPAAEQFVQLNAQRMMTVLADASRSLTARKRAFRVALDHLADVPAITGLALGKYGRTLCPGQFTRLAMAFRDHVEGVCQVRLNDHGDRTLTVTGSTVRKPGDVIVDTMISGGHLSAPLAVSWRVRGGPSARRVVDVQFEGVWLAITLQQNFVSTLDKAGGDVEVLIAQLRKSAA